MRSLSLLLPSLLPSQLPSRLCTAAAGMTTLTVCLLTLPALPAQAQIQVLTMNGGEAAFTGVNHTRGWSFSTSTTVTVTDLGIYDQDNNGLNNSHQVGLWTSVGGFITSTTLSSGLSGTATVLSVNPVGSFRYNSITPVVLAPGSYVVGAQYQPGDNDGFLFDTPAPSLISGFSFMQSRTSAGGTGFAFPDSNSGTDNSYFGPNLRIATSAPEPGSIALLSIGIAGMAGVVIRKRRL